MGKKRFADMQNNVIVSESRVVLYSFTCNYLYSTYSRIQGDLGFIIEHLLFQKELTFFQNISFTSFLKNNVFLNEIYFFFFFFYDNFNVL